MSLTIRVDDGELCRTLNAVLTHAAHKPPYDRVHVQITPQGITLTAADRYTCAVAHIPREPWGGPPPSSTTSFCLSQADAADLGNDERRTVRTEVGTAQLTVDNGTLTATHISAEDPETVGKYPTDPTDPGELPHLKARIIDALQSASTTTGPAVLDSPHVLKMGLSAEIIERPLQIVVQDGYVIGCCGPNLIMLGALYEKAGAERMVSDWSEKREQWLRAPDSPHERKAMP